MSLPPSLSRLGRMVYSLPISTDHLLASARGLSFWTAVALPFSYLPLFGLDVFDLTMELFVLLLLVNIVALVVGHSHHR